MFCGYMPRQAIFTSLCFVVILTGLNRLPATKGKNVLVIYMHKTFKQKNVYCIYRYYESALWELNKTNCFMIIANDPN